MLGLELHFIAMERNQLCNHYSNATYILLYLISISISFKRIQYNSDKCYQNVKYVQYTIITRSNSVCTFYEFSHETKYVPFHAQCERERMISRGCVTEGMTIVAAQHFWHLATSYRINITYYLTFIVHIY